MLKINKTININNVILRNRLHLFLAKREKGTNQNIDKKRSYYLDNLLNKRIQSQLVLQKSKIDYYLDKLNNKNNFHRDYSIFYNYNKSFINNKKCKSIQSDSLHKSKFFYKSKFKLIPKNKNANNKDILPSVKANIKSLTVKPNFSNNFVNKKINHKLSYIKNQNIINFSVEDNNYNNNKKKYEIESYMKK